MTPRRIQTVSRSTHMVLWALCASVTTKRRSAIRVVFVRNKCSVFTTLMTPFTIRRNLAFGARLAAISPSSWFSTRLTRCACGSILVHNVWICAYLTLHTKAREIVGLAHNTVISRLIRLLAWCTRSARLMVLIHHIRCCACLTHTSHRVLVACALFTSSTYVRFSRLAR